MRRSAWVAVLFFVGVLVAGPGRADDPPSVAGPSAEQTACCGVKEKAAAEVKDSPAWRDRRQQPVRPWADYNKRITWAESFDAGQRTAVDKRRMLLAMQVVGNLKDEGC